MWANKRLEFKITYPNCNKWKEFWKWGVPNQGLGRGHLSLIQLSGVPLYTALVQWNFLPSTAEGKVYITFTQFWPILSCYISKIVTSNDRNLGTSKKPGTVLLMQNVNLGHTKVIQIRQGAIIHEGCCSAAQCCLVIQGCRKVKIRFRHSWWLVEIEYCAWFQWLMCGSCHILHVLISVEYGNSCLTLDVYLLSAVWMRPIKSRLIYIFVTCELASL